MVITYHNLINVWIVRMRESLSFHNRSYLRKFMVSILYNLTGILKDHK